MPDSERMLTLMLGHLPVRIDAGVIADAIRPTVEDLLSTDGRSLDARERLMLAAGKTFMTLMLEDVRSKIRSGALAWPEPPRARRGENVLALGLAYVAAALARTVSGVECELDFHEAEDGAIVITGLATAPALDSGEPERRALPEPEPAGVGGAGRAGDARGARRGDRHESSRSVVRARPNRQRQDTVC